MISVPCMGKAHRRSARREWSVFQAPQYGTHERCRRPSSSMKWKSPTAATQSRKSGAHVSSCDHLYINHSLPVQRHASLSRLSDVHRGSSQAPSSAIRVQSTTAGSTKRIGTRNTKSLRVWKSPFLLDNFFQLQFFFRFKQKAKAVLDVAYSTQGASSKQQLVCLRLGRNCERLCLKIWINFVSPSKGKSTILLTICLRSEWALSQRRWPNVRWAACLGQPNRGNFNANWKNNVISPTYGRNPPNWGHW